MQYVLQYFYNKKMRYSEHTEQWKVRFRRADPSITGAPHTSRKQRAFLPFLMLSDEALHEV